MKERDTHYRYISELAYWTIKNCWITECLCGEQRKIWKIKVFLSKVNSWPTFRCSVVRECILLGPPKPEDLSHYGQTKCRKLITSPHDVMIAEDFNFQHRCESRKSRQKVFDSVQTTLNRVALYLLMQSCFTAKLRWHISCLLMHL
jgi:hypothetical protein